ncbi:MAG: Phosphoserine phosphatase 1 [Planctomycetota bacterium]|jgi:broad specificity phosphatase PhoE
MPADDPGLKPAILAALAAAVEDLPEVRSATLAGSFAAGTGLNGISDIDTILVVDPLDGPGFARVQAAFRDRLAPVLAVTGWDLRINATLGPLKFNAERLAVLHLMCYSPESHREHVINSPFTCLDWQRSPVWWRAPLGAVYPVFALQPRHFFGARRSAADYLADLRAGVVSYRELDPDQGMREIKRGHPMAERDRHEFAYHILRFLMQNLLKLVRRENRCEDGEALREAFFAVFPDGAAEFAALHRELAVRKHAGDFSDPLPGLVDRVAAFAQAFERQFRAEFATGDRIALVRHAPTALNGGSGGSAILQGAGSDPDPLPIDPAAVAACAARLGAVDRWLVSPLRRTVATARAIGATDAGMIREPRLVEIRYGACEGMSAAAAQATHPDLAAAWARGEDPAFPGGESSAAVRARALAVLADAGPGTTVAVTHNVVIRELVGHLMQVPAAGRWRLRVPHLVPVMLVRSRRFGWYVDLDEPAERGLFSAFLDRSPRP